MYQTKKIIKELSPCLLIGTGGCINTALDSEDIHLVIKMGIQIGVIDFIPEKDRFGCNSEEYNND